jgi:N-methylhydantoinase A
MHITEAAAGIHRVVNETMAAATRMYMAEKGRDLRQFKLLAFGGAGPVHAYGLAKLLKLKGIIVPLGAGAMSALGLLVAAPAVDVVRTYKTPLGKVDWSRLNQILSQMETEARSTLRDALVGKGTVQVHRMADMRYVGQGFEIAVPMPNGELSEQTLPEMYRSFYSCYERLFGFAATDLPVEAVTWRVNVAGPPPHVPLSLFHEGATTGAKKGVRQAHFAGFGFVEATVYDRYRLAPGFHAVGPAIVEENESTTVVGPDASFRIDDRLNVVVEFDPVQV